MGIDINHNRSDAPLERLRKVFGRRKLIQSIAGIALLACGWVFLGESRAVLVLSHKLAQVDGGLSSSVAELRVLQARQAMTSQTILELAADGQQEMTPAWRSVAIHNQRHGQAFHNSLHEMLLRVRLQSSRGSEFATLESQLCMAELHERLQNDIQTVIRLTDEGRSAEIAAMHAPLLATGDSVAELLQNLNNFSNISLLNSAKRIQRAMHRAFWSGLGAIVFGTIFTVLWWSSPPSKRRGSFTREFDKAEDNHDPVEIAAEQALAERFLLRGVHVLVAEDDIASRRQLARVFENAGAVVTIACDGGHALRQFRKASASGHPVQLVIMDLRMPVLDGLQAVMQLRDLDYFEGPVLALTETNGLDVRSECLEAGFDDYLPKPIDGKRLLQLATDYLGKSVAV